jgi:hypothetical protein
MADGPEISSWIGLDFITALLVDCRHAPSTYSLAQKGILAVHCSIDSKHLKDYRQQGVYTRMVMIEDLA